MTSRDTVIGGSTTGFFSPGGSGEFPRTTPTLDRDLFATRQDLASGVDSMFRPNAQGMLNVQIVVQGFNAVTDHAHVVDVLIPGGIGIIHQVTGRLTVDEARKSMQSDFGRPPIDTGDTLRSIHARLETTPDKTITNVGPTTFYSPLIEFGLAAHFKYGPRPFMSLAFAKVLPDHLAALRELAMVASGPAKAIRNQQYSGEVNSFISRLRDHLYTIEKQIGDTVPMGGAFNFQLPGQGLRGGLILFARGLGDIQSVLSSAVGARFVRRLQGRITGRLVGIGSNTIFAQRTIGARITLAEREYNKVALPAMSRFMSQSRLFGGGGIGG